MILTYFKGPSILAEHIDRLNKDIDDIGVDVYMGKNRDVPKVSIEGERALATYTSIPTFTF